MIINIRKCQDSQLNFIKYIFSKLIFTREKWSINRIEPINHWTQRIHIFVEPDTTELSYSGCCEFLNKLAMIFLKENNMEVAFFIDFQDRNKMKKYQEFNELLDKHNSRDAK